jgi:uncharacterized protein YbjT (DUF2867 family)
MRILILGGSGFIGFEVARELAERGHDVTALARAPGRAVHRQTGISWIRRDLRSMASAQDWAFLDGFDAVVNCAGVLQSGAGDDVNAVQQDAMLALYAAAKAAGTKLIVQISARTEGAGAGRDFLASKHKADSALKQSGLPFVILRPALVIGRNAHGGSALLRALAALPWRTPLVHPDAPMQFVSVDDVSNAVAEALEGRISTSSDFALACPGTLSLRAAVAAHRAWLGLPAIPAIAVPMWIASPVAAVADLLGWLGWRSPLRSTAMEIARGGIVAATPDEGGRSLAPLVEILSKYPSGVQDLWFARLYFLKPAVIGVLSLFWLLSGAIALAKFDRSASMLIEATGVPVFAKLLTVATSVADILLGGAVLVRRYARPALIGMILVSLGYLAAATALSPQLWLDPMGPLVKVLPSIVLAVVALAILDER